MPRAAAEIGAAAQVLPLAKIAAAVVAHAPA
jgi:chemotaxis response regulator CheB